MAFALRLWTKKMGSTLLSSAVTGGGSYATHDWRTWVNFQGEVPYLSAHATRSADGSRLALLVVNRHPDQPRAARIGLAHFTPQPRARVITLTGPSYLAHNDVADRQPAYHSFPDAPDPAVVPQETERDISGPQFEHTFLPHSVTVLSLLAAPGAQ